MRFVDANVILRYLLDDDPLLAEKASVILDALANSLKCVLRQAQHERYFNMLPMITVHPELVEG